MGTSQNNVLAFSDTKIAALINENVIPVEIRDVMSTEESTEPSIYEILSSILPPSLVDQSRQNNLSKEINNYIANYLCAFPNVLGIENLANGQTLKQRAEESLPGLIKSLHGTISCSNNPITETIGLPSIPIPTGNTQDINLKMTGLKAVNAQKMSWRHILEFREDKNSQAKLRNLNIFLTDDYEGKSVQYIEDSISQKIEAYEQTTKTWGLESSEACREIIFSSESLMTFASAALLTAIAGPALFPAAMTTKAIISAAIGSSFAIGKINIKMGKRKRELLAFKKDSPISYLIDVKDKIGENSL